MKAQQKRRENALTTFAIGIQQQDLNIPNGLDGPWGMVGSQKRFTTASAFAKEMEKRDTNMTYTQALKDALLLATMLAVAEATAFEAVASFEYDQADALRSVTSQGGTTYTLLGSKVDIAEQLGGIDRRVRKAQFARDVLARENVRKKVLAAA